MLDKTTDPKREMIERMASERASSAEIGAALGMTRHAVIGYCYRRGIRLLQNGKDGAQRTAAIKHGPEAMRRIKNLSIPAKPARPIRAASSVCPLPEGAGVRLLDLEHGQCRFPLWGDERPNSGLFCGAQSETGHSWCPDHRKVVYASSASALAAS